MPIFGQVWLWSSLAFLLGALLCWLLVARPARNRVGELEAQLATQARRQSASERPESAGGRDDARSVVPGLGDLDDSADHLTRGYRLQATPPPPLPPERDRLAPYPAAEPTRDHTPAEPEPFSFSGGLSAPPEVSDTELADPPRAAATQYLDVSAGSLTAPPEVPAMSQPPSDRGWFDDELDGDAANQAPEDQPAVPRNRHHLAEPDEQFDARLVDDVDEDTSISHALDTDEEEQARSATEDDSGGTVFTQRTHPIPGELIRQIDEAGKEERAAAEADNLVDDLADDVLDNESDRRERTVESEPVAAPADAAAQEPFAEPQHLDEQKPFAEQQSFGEKQSFAESQPLGEQQRFDEPQPFGEPKPFAEQQRFGEQKSFGESQSFGEQQGVDEQKSFAERQSFGEAQPLGEQQRFGDEQKSFGESQSFGEQQGVDEQKSFAEQQSFGEAQSLGEQQRFGDEQKSFGESQSFGEQQGVDEQKSFAERQSFGEAQRFDEPQSFVEQPFGDQQPAPAAFTEPEPDAAAPAEQPREQTEVVAAVPDEQPEPSRPTSDLPRRVPQQNRIAPGVAVRVDPTPNALPKRVPGKPRHHLPFGVDPTPEPVAAPVAAAEEPADPPRSLFEPIIPAADEGMSTPPPPHRLRQGSGGGRGPFGPGSAMPLPGGASPSPEFTIKASVAALRYCTPDSPQFGRTVAEVWFRTAADAERVGFRPVG